MLQNVEFINSFIEEAKVHAENLESELLRADVEAMDSDTINNIFRAVHSIKGTAGFFNLKKIVDLSHSMENIFGECRAGRFKLTGGMVDKLLSCNDCLKAMIEDAANSEDYDITKQLEALLSIQSGSMRNKAENVKTSDIVENENGDARIPLNKKELLMELYNQGHSLYQFKLWLHKDLEEINISPAQLIKEIKSIGNIIDCRFELDDPETGPKDQTDDIQVAFLFTSVLEKDLLKAALSIYPENLEEIELFGKACEEEGNDLSLSWDTDAQSKENILSEEEKKEPAHKKNQNPIVEDSIRVHVNLLNNLLNLASEMVLGRNQLLRAMESHRKSISGIDPILQNIDHITTDLQEKIMQTRMQPISNVFNKFPRIIRDLSKKIGKDINLKQEGSEVELDKSIIEALADPLTHLVRNAADHGLEMPAERESAGKTRTGSIMMKAYHEGGYVNIDVTDDGKGISTEDILKKGIEKGFITKSDAAIMCEQEIYQLLFKPGFSTAEKVTDVSGRGVGLDVVKTNIEKMGGTIEIFSSIKKGTTFRLLLPLTLAIISSLIVETENQKFALPQVNLQEIVRIKANDPLKKIEYINNAEVIRLRGKLLPIVHLADVLGLARTYADPKTGIRKIEKRRNLFDSRRLCEESVKAADEKIIQAERRRSNNNTVRILVVKIGSRRLGIVVDAIYGSEEILVKPLPAYIKECRCYSGVTILGDGKTAMILDPGGVIDKANLRFTDGNEEIRDKNIPEADENMTEQQNLLIFKCSGSETLTVDLSMVSRVEEIDQKAIEKIGDREYINFRGSSLRVIRPEDFLPINKVEGKKDRLYVIIPKLVSHPMGILVEKIHDTVRTGIKTVHEDIKTKGFMGSTILDNKIVILINLYELFELADPDHYQIYKSIKTQEKINVLLVEDTPFFEKMEKNYLEVAGYNVIATRNGREALEALQENPVDVVVSDINMPVMDGIELVKKIRRSKEFSDLPVIAVTSLTGELQKKTGLEAGFDYYEFKLDRVRLLDVLEQAIQKRRKPI